MPGIETRYHPRFFKELEALTNAQLGIVHKKIERIKQNPEQAKGLKGKNNCYTVRIENMRLVYYFEGSDLWFLVLENRKSVYDEYLKRFYSIRQKLE